jgi:mono/diheme cytochrome c family protein
MTVEPMITSRVVLLFVLFAAGCGPALAESDPQRGEEVYATACARCHASVARTVRRIDGGTQEEREAWLAGFLPEHYAEQDADLSDLIAFLLDR